jgi:hypothetical protein
MPGRRVTTALTPAPSSVTPGLTSLLRLNNLHGHSLANLRETIESPGFKSQMHKKIREKRIQKTTREGHRILHSDMRWLVTDVRLRGRRDNSNNGKDL